MEGFIALAALTAMEIVLGIDNIVFIAILTSRLPVPQQPQARRLGLMLALLARILLLLTLQWILGLEAAIFQFSSLGYFQPWLAAHPEMNQISWRDVILFCGGLFLIGKSVHEIHEKLEGHDHQVTVNQHPSFAGVLVQIAILDIVFSLDSVITAVGMADQLWVMITAIILAIAVMMVFAETVSAFVERHPTLKMLGLSFLILIGVMLVAEGIGTHINKGYIYFAMAFALVVEVLNLRLHSIRRRAEPSGKS
jgi:predicted tellurium resistance membrane protein TerC